MQMRDVEDGGKIIVAGEEADALFLLLGGTVRTSAVPAPWSDEPELSTRFPGPLDLAPAPRRARTIPAHSPPSGNRCTH